MDIAFIGIGVMGGPMAAHLLRQGHRLRVYNRSPAKAITWQQRHGGEACESVAEAAGDAAVLITCVGRDEDLREICLGDFGAYAHLSPGALHVDHTTSSVGLARELAEIAASRDLAFVDAPVSGGQSGAEQGTLTVMCGGNEKAYARAASVFSAYATSHGHMGPAGSGQLAKMVNQICVAGLIQGLSEGLAFGERAGLDMNRVLDVIEQGAAASWQMQHRARTMLRREFDFGFAVDWMRKDLGYLLDQAEEMGLTLPVTRQVSQNYDAISAAGGGRWDTSSLITRLDEAEEP